MPILVGMECNVWKLEKTLQDVTGQHSLMMTDPLHSPFSPPRSPTALEQLNCMGRGGEPTHGVLIVG